MILMVCINSFEDAVKFYTDADTPFHINSYICKPIKEKKADYRHELYETVIKFLDKGLNDIPNEKFLYRGCSSVNFFQHLLKDPNLDGLYEYEDIYSAREYLQGKTYTHPVYCSTTTDIESVARFLTPPEICCLLIISPNSIPCGKFVGDISVFNRTTIPEEEFLLNRMLRFQFQKIIKCNIPSLVIHISLLP